MALRSTSLYCSLTLAALFVSLLLRSSPAIAQSARTCSVTGTPQVSSTLVLLENSVTRTTYKRGKPIHVTLTLKAGSEGVYLPDFFGPFLETCSHGFATEVLTFEGRAANPIEPGCGHAGPNAAIRYVELEPGEARTWSTNLPTTSIAPGHYCLYAEYFSSEQLFDRAENLPDDKSLVAKGRIQQHRYLFRFADKIKARLC